MQALRLVLTVCLCGLGRLGASRLVLLTLVLLVAAQGTGAAEPADRTAVRAMVDAHINQRLKEQGIAPAALCDDATFLRRASLDLTGRNPTSGEVLAFLNDSSPDKRGRLVDRLLDSPTSAVHLANIWSGWLLPEMQEPTLPGAGQSGLHTWLRNRFANNLRYDRMVADLLVASGPTVSGPGLFFTALEGKPEKIAAKTSRVFLGVQLDCAECHDHPFDDWKQRDFWSFAAYFAQLSADGMQIPGSGEVRDRNEGEVRLPGSEEVIAPRPLVTTGMSGLASGSRRQQLTLWLTARENPYLARAAVNRCWSILFGRGLIEPIDDMRSLEMASHPELLRDLAAHFANDGFDLRSLLGTLAMTEAYQRVGTPAGQGIEAIVQNSYATMPLKPLTANQLATCMHQVARDIVGEDGRNKAAALATQLGKLRGDHSAAALGIVQALVTLHSPQLDDVHGPAQSRLLQALSAPHLNTEKRIQWMFLSTLCRYPTSHELAAILEIGTDEQWQADLLWALVNSTEFAITP